MADSAHGLVLAFGLPHRQDDRGELARQRQLLGGMGEVYRAKDTKLGREVAIKLLLEEVSQDPERLARFEREARVLASLNHNNIATLYGFEHEGDTSFLVMELVEGETLAEVFEESRRATSSTVRFT